MKKSLLLAFFAALACTAPAVVMDGVAARVDGEIITMGDILTEAHRNPALREKFTAASRDRARLAALYKEVVEDIIDRRLILKEAAHKKMEMQEWLIDNRVREIVKEHFHGDRNELVQELQKTNTSMDEWRNTIREDLILAGMRYQIVDQYVQQPSPGAMRREYDEHRSRYVEDARVTVSTILLKPEEGRAPVKERAVQILAALDKPGADFATLARDHSADSHAKDGGLWKDIKPEDEFRPEIVDALAKLKVGEHSQLVDLDGWGFILRKEAEHAAKKLSFAEAYEKIARNAYREAENKAFADWMARLRKQAFIQIYPMPEN